jgi:excinuclease ABC subunit C
LKEDWRHIIHTLPSSPGIYRYYNEGGELLYVGKAKNIKKRVSSYFGHKAVNRKTAELVSRIHTIQFTIVHSEADALLLENNLIKQYKPLFNIDLKDDKTYPYIVIKKEPFPRVFLTRKKLNDGSTYLGPFTSTGKVREFLDLIRQLLPVRTCKLNLSEQHIRSHKYKVCLEFQLGNCKGPCEGLQDSDDYMTHIAQIKNILNGRMSLVMQFLKSEMQLLAADMKFEKAATIKKKIEFLENYQSSSAVVNPKMGDADVFCLIREDEKVFINYLMVKNGAVIQSDNTEVDVKVDDDEADILSTVIQNTRTIFHSTAPEIIVPFQINWSLSDVQITIPKRGPKHSLLEMSRSNAAYQLKEYKRKKSLLLTDNKTNTEEVLTLLKQKLHLPVWPDHIECFDNSNFQGSYPVAAMVCFKHGEPSKKDYRTYHIKTVTGIDDFASMKEVVFRRYARLKSDGASLPQLVIIDGGKGQLNAAYESIRTLALENKITLIGLAKNVEEIFFIHDHESLKLPINDPALLFIRQIRDEVHRFGLQFHRNLRSKGSLRNQLENIDGIGPKTIDLLMKKFRSVEGIMKADKKEMDEIIGESKADKVREYLKKGGRIEIQPRL